MTFKQGLLIFVLGAAAGIGFTCFGTNRQIASLKLAGAVAAAHAKQSDSLAVVAHDSTVQAVSRLNQVEQAASAGAASADKRVQVFHDALHALVDSNAAAKAILDSLDRAHADEVAGLTAAKAASDAKVLILQAESVSQLQTIHDLSKQVQDLNSQIQKLNSHALPGWARTGFEVVRSGLAIWKGVELVRGR